MSLQFTFAFIPERRSGFSTKASNFFSWASAARLECDRITRMLMRSNARLVIWIRMAQHKENRGEAMQSRDPQNWLVAG
jgi:hypothetical protein